MILRQDRSKFGTFIRSPIGIRTQAPSVSTVIPLLFGCHSSRIDRPFGTIVPNNMITETYASDPSAQYVVGLTNNLVGDAFRQRIGLTFAIPSMAATKYTMNFNFVATTPFGISLYASSADYSSLYSTVSNKAAWDWESHLDSLVASDVNANDVVIPASAFTAFLGGNMSFVLVAAGDAANTYTGINCQLFINTTLSLS